MRVSPLLDYFSTTGSGSRVFGTRTRNIFETKDRGENLHCSARVLTQRAEKRANSGDQEAGIRRSISPTRIFRRAGSFKQRARLFAASGLGAPNSIPPADESSRRVYGETKVSFRPRKRRHRLRQRRRLRRQRSLITRLSPAAEFMGIHLNRERAPRKIALKYSSAIYMFARRPVLAQAGSFLTAFPFPVSSSTRTTTTTPLLFDPPACLPLRRG